MSAASILFSQYMGLPKEVYVIFAARMINALGCFVFPLLTLILTDSIGLSKQEAGTYMSLAGIISIPAALLGGKLADSIGRKKVIVLFDSLAIALYLVAGTIQPSVSMVYLIISAGAAMFAAGPGHDSLMADITTPENRNAAFALSYMGWNLGFAIGPVIGGLLYKKHLPLVFFGDAFTALISLLLLILFVRETLAKTHQDVAGVKRGEKRRNSIFSELLRRPVLLYVALIGFGYHFVYSQWTFMLPMHAVQNFGEAGAGLYGTMAGLNGLVVILFTPLVTKISGKAAEIRRMVYGVFLYALGFGMLGVLNSLPFFYLSVFVFTLGEITLAVSVMPFIANHTPVSHRGRMNAIVPVIMSLGFSLGPVGMGKVLGHMSIESGWLVVGVGALICALLFLLLEKQQMRQNSEFKVLHPEGP